MKTYKKKEMLKVLKILDKASTTIGDGSQVNPADAIDLLVRCQELAIHLGMSIETLGKSYIYLIRNLEDYCENLYQVSLSLSDHNRCKDLWEIIQNQLSDLSRSIKRDLPDDKKEILFLPYKASMWDSLESMWKAAEEDDNCDAYVIPIPYFDKNPDGSFREMHYEGDQYPKYVPITHYEEYDFEGRKPDMIVIHNPYDDCNYVTSVHPFFYSENLKKFTDKLVYVPYFILDEMKVNNKSEVEGIKHFCLTPGVLHSDRIIVQSEDMKQIYIHVLAEAMGNTEKARQYWGNRILGLGSPKVDKVLNTKKENLSIPKKWLELIQKPDGSWKKVIFYNTGITAFLDNSEQALKKIEFVFSIFKKRKDEVTLLWRPHPLIESTIISMRPQYWAQYQAVKDQYIQEAWGILDDTTDLDRAVAVSDGYYGDMSSVLQLFKKTGKAAMLQDVKIHGGLEDNRIIASRDFIIEGDSVILISYETNLMTLASLKNKKIEQVYFFEKECYGKDLYLSFKKIGRIILAVPYNGTDFRTIDLVTGEQSVITGILNKKETLLKEKFIGTVVLGSMAWFIGERIQKIICFNLDLFEVEYTVDLKDFISGITDENPVLWSPNYCINEDLILVPSRNRNLVLQIDTKTNRVQFKCLDGNRQQPGFFDIYKTGDYYCITDLTGHELRFDMEMRFLDDYAIVESDNNYSWKCVRYKNKKVFFMAFEAMIVIYDQLSGTKKSLIIENEKTYKEAVAFLGIVLIENKVYFQTSNSGIIYQLDLENYKYKRYIMDLGSEIKEKIKEMTLKYYILNRDLLLENSVVSVGDMMKVLCECGKTSKVDSYVSGKLIYERLIHEINCCGVSYDT